MSTLHPMAWEHSQPQPEIVYHAIRQASDGKRIEEIRVSRPAGGSFRDMREEHVAFHATKRDALAAIHAANGV